MRSTKARASVTALLLATIVAACDTDARPTDDTPEAGDTSTANLDDFGRPLPPAGPPVTGDGCALVQESAVEEAVGFDVVMNDNATGNCVLTPASGAADAPTFDFRIEPRANAYDYFSAQPDATPIAGMGDRAIWATANEMTGYVVIVRGAEAIVVAVARADELTADSRRRAESLARLLLAARG